VIADVVKKKGDTAAVGEVIGFIDKDGKPADGAAKKPVEQIKPSPRKPLPSRLRKLASCRSRERSCRTQS